MTKENLVDVELITQPRDLLRLAEVLNGEARVAVDTESDSLYSYREKVCLIQFSTRQADYLVDPLALHDLTPLAPLFGNPAIEKVFHAAEYDLVCLRRDFGFEFNNIFDTMLAARILGREQVGLGSILKAEFGVELDKRQQRANWSQRPLPAKLLDYARLDTHYLLELSEKLGEQLEQQNLLPLAREDFERMSVLKSLPVNGQGGNSDAVVCWRVSGAHDLSPQQAAILQELCTYRERMARSLDRPLFKVIGDQTLLAIATRAPQNADELSRMPGMSPRQMQRHSHQLLQAVQRGLKADPIYPPRQSRPDDAFLRRLDDLREWRKVTAQEMGVPSDVVLPRDLMITLAERNPRNEQQLAQALEDVPWRLQNFGAQILRLLK